MIVLTLNTSDKNKSAFWRVKSPAEMTGHEWESLCDGCAKCCLQKLEYEDTGEIIYTCLVCRYLDEASCRCTCYSTRTGLVPNCLKLQPDTITKIHFLPRTCAYRLIAEGKELSWWHPLVSGDPNSVHSSGMSIRGKVLNEEYVHPDGWEDYIVDWVDEGR